MKKQQTGFGAIEGLLLIVLVGLIGFIGWFVWHSQKNTSNSYDNAASASASTAQTKEASTGTYAGWKTYHSALNSGMSFKYPADWDFTPPPKQALAPNKSGIVENPLTLRSAKIQGTYGTVTNQYMCVNIDESSDNGLASDSWTFGKELSSEQLTIGGKPATLSTYAGDSPMQSQLILHAPNVSAGNHFVAEKKKFIVSVYAAFNACQQPAGGEGITDKQADFNQQPETAIAKNIIKSIQF